jgi:hypothetical protein
VTSNDFTTHTMQNPAVPMIQLPMKFKSRRTNTATQKERVPKGYYVDILTQVATFRKRPSETEFFSSNVSKLC